MLSYFDFKISTAAFFSVVPNKLGGILTTSCKVEIENNFGVFAGIEFMNLWVFFVFSDHVFPHYFVTLDSSFTTSKID